MDMGVHAIDTARFLLGDPDPDRVCAAIGTRYAEGRYQVDDDGILLIAWSNGTNSVVESGWWQPHLGGLEADTEVYGTAGYARIWPPDPPSVDYEHCTQPMYTRTGRRVPRRDRGGSATPPVRGGRSDRDAGRRGRLPIGGPRMSAVLGVDGGGRKTHAVIVDTSGELLGAGVADASNWELVGIPGAMDAIGEAADRASRRRQASVAATRRPSCWASRGSTGRRTSDGSRSRSTPSGSAANGGS